MIQFENPLYNEKTTECDQKAEWRCDSAHFPFVVIGYRCHAVRRVELINYSVRFGRSMLFAYFTVKTKAYNAIMFVLFSYDCSL